MRREQRSYPALVWVVSIGMMAMLAGVGASSQAVAQEAHAVRLFSAGSLRAAMTDIAKAFTSAYGIPVDITFGAAGLLRERIEKGDAADVFASANMDNPQKLVQGGKAGPVVRFARNSLCAIARPGLSVAPDRLLTAMLDPAVKLGTSTPKADPSGDYTWDMFGKAEAIEAGSRAKLEAKARQLMGGAHSAPPPAGVNVVAWHLRERRADLFIAYCSGAPEALAQLPGATVVALPPLLATGADYGLTILKGGQAGPAGELALFILSPEGQKILTQYGFEAPLL